MGAGGPAGASLAYSWGEGRDFVGDPGGGGGGTGFAVEKTGFWPG